ncbi:unnamed protein product [Cylindrotheca closterium]|uniref:HSF-type DNA-binding domain-containing protein n=1 Tax=Cylindrotheca closterium TaxID=2856 RepID=A0AAD2FL59_9STRA|nr:unnamed protein product [Cylindrotheca closterium]
MTQVPTQEPSKAQCSNGNDAKAKKNPGKASNRPKNNNFPAKLHTILSTPEFNDIICWLPHGRAFRVQQQGKLESEVLPKFFQHQKVASFYRQVTGWGFNRITKGTDFNAYYHELFLRDAPELCNRMKRPTRAELAERKIDISKSPPDFYAIPQHSDTKNRKNDEETVEHSSASEHDMTLDDFKDMLVRRLSTYSSSEMGQYLQFEMNKLEKKRAAILESLKELNGSQNRSTSAPAPPAIRLQPTPEPQHSRLNNLQHTMLLDPVQLAHLQLMQSRNLRTSPLQAMSQMALANHLLSGTLGSEQHSFNRPC